MTITLRDKTRFELREDTDASTLRWLLQGGLVDPNSAAYSLLRRIIKKRFNCDITGFIDMQPLHMLPLMDAQTFLDNLPPEAHDPLVWAHPVLWVIHGWQDNASELIPKLPSIAKCTCDLHAAITLLCDSSTPGWAKDKVRIWIGEKLGLTEAGFRELFVKTQILHKFNYFARTSVTDVSLVIRYRQDVKQLIERGKKAITQAQDTVTLTEEEVGKVEKAVNLPALTMLLEELERIDLEWQKLRSLRALNNKNLR